MEKTLTIQNLRSAENNYAALSKITSDLSDFEYNSIQLTNKEMEKLDEALEILRAIEERLFTNAKQITKQYLKTYYYAKSNKKTKR